MKNVGDQVWFPCDWLRKWCKFSEPIKKRSEAKLMQSRSTLDTLLTTVKAKPIKFKTTLTHQRNWLDAISEGTN